MGTSGDIASAIGGGMQAFGSNETRRRGGGGDDAKNLGLQALAARSQKKVEEGAKEAAGGGSGAVSLKKGGRIPKTGIYRLHKGEEVIPADKVKRIEKKRKATRKSGRR